MLTVLPSFLPIWALAALGFAARRSGVLDASAGQALTAFVFSFAAPALVFSTLADAEPRGVLNPAVLGFAATSVIGVLLVGALSWWWWRRRAGEQVVTGMAAGQVNSANLGLPVAAQVLGGTEFIIAVILFQTVVLTPACLLMIELLSGRADGRGRWRLVGAPLRNPIVVAALAGLLVLLTGLPLPEAALLPVDMLGRAAVPAGLFVLGMALHRAPGTPASRTRPTEVASVVAVKLLAQPAVAAGIGTALGVSGPPLLALVLCSGLPTAQNVFVFAHHYRLVPGFVRDTVFVSTLLSMGTLVCITILFSP